MTTENLKAITTDDNATRIHAAQTDASKACALIRELPAIAELLSATARAQRTWARLMAKDELTQASVQYEIDQMRSALLGPNPSGIECMLVERAVTCALQANYFDLIEGGNHERSLAQAELALKRQDRAHRRHLLALKTLAEIRKLTAPTVQVNIANRQVNVGVTPAGTHRAPTES